MNNPPPHSNFWHIDDSTSGTYQIPSPLLHRRRTWTSYPNRCDNCKMNFKNILDLKQHQKTEHGKFCGFKCSDCNILIPFFENFIQHVREHRPELIAYCPICDIRLIHPNHINYNTETCLGKPSFILPTSEYKVTNKAAFDESHSFGGTRKQRAQKLRTAKKFKYLARQQRGRYDPLQRPTGDVNRPSTFADNCDYTTQVVMEVPAARPKIETPCQVTIAQKTDGGRNYAGDDVLRGWADIFLANSHRLEESMDGEN